MGPSGSLLGTHFQGVEKVPRKENFAEWIKKRRKGARKGGEGSMGRGGAEKWRGSMRGGRSKEQKSWASVSKPDGKSASL